jgi:hypothetical protein
MSVIDSASVADAGAFVARVVRLDDQAVVRLRARSLWAMLPFGVLVTRGVRAADAVDATVRASELLSALGRLLPVTVPNRGAGRGVGSGLGPVREVEPLRVLPARHDAAWRWPLPPDGGQAIEELPADAVLRVSAAAAETVRAAGEGGIGGRPVGSRVLRDALLDHVPIVVTTTDGVRVPVPQRLIQAVTRMGFVPDVGDDGIAAPVVVRATGTWVGLAGAFGTAWHRPAGGPLSLRPVR